MKILLATDGSKHAEYAERLVSNLLAERLSETDLTALTVCRSADLHNLGIDFPETIHEMVEHCRNQSEQIVNGVSERLASRVKSFGAHIADGHPAREVVHQIEELQPDLCVVGSHGWTFSERFFLGSVSSQVAKHAACSVLVAKPRENQFDLAQVKRILIADDGTEHATDAIANLKSLPLNDSQSVRLVSVFHNNFVVEALIPEQVGEIAEKRKQRMAERLQRDAAEFDGTGASVDYEVRIGTSVSHELVHAAEEFAADLIVLSGSKKAVLERALMGSVSLSVLHLAKCSVLIERT